MATVLLVAGLPCVSQATGIVPLIYTLFETIAVL